MPASSTWQPCKLDATDTFQSVPESIGLVPSPNILFILCSASSYKKKKSSMLALKQSYNSSMVLGEGWGSSSEAAVTEHFLQIISKHPSHHLISPPRALPAVWESWTGLLGENKTVCPVTEPAPNVLNVMDVKTGREQQNFLIITSWRWSKYLDCITVLLLPIGTLPPSALLPVPQTISLHWRTHIKQVKTSASLYIVRNH